jgi:hypothetical protein
MTETRRYLSLLLMACVFVMDGYDINAMARSGWRRRPSAWSSRRC